MLSSEAIFAAITLTEGEMKKWYDLMMDSTTNATDQEEYHRLYTKEKETLERLKATL